MRGHPSTCRIDGHGRRCIVDRYGTALMHETAPGEWSLSCKPDIFLSTYEPDNSASSAPSSPEAGRG